MPIIRRDRIGSPLPQLCNSDASSKGLLVYSFGYSVQEVLNCPATEEVLLSSQACLRSFEDNAYVSAEYRSQGQEGSSLIFNASITYKPSETCRGTNGIPRGPRIRGNVNNPCDSGGGAGDECIKKSTNPSPDPILDPSSINLSLNNLGLANLSFVLTTRRETFDIGHFSLALGSNAVFKGYIVNISTEPLSGTEYYDHRILAIGEII